MNFIDDAAQLSSSSCSRRSASSLVRRQARYWLLTIPADSSYVPGLYGFDYTKGQKEQGESGYLHWQVFGYSKKKISLRFLQVMFGFNGFHAEPSFSQAAEDYVWKEDTRIEGTQFEFGKYPSGGNLTTNWDLIRSAAQAGNLESEDIPASVFVHAYSSLRRIATDYMVPTAQERTTTVVWGKTGLGKSRYAWSQAGWEAYPKDPNSKFWCGYRGQPNVVIDEFRGGININHLLRWTDRYPVIVEIKGSAKVFTSTQIWITSNLHPKDWYPELDSDTYDALMRRFTTIIHADSYVFDWDLPTTPNIEILQ